MFFEHLLGEGTFISFFSPRQPRGGVLLPFSTEEPLRSREHVLRVPATSGGAGISNSTQSVSHPGSFLRGPGLPGGQWPHSQRGPRSLGMVVKST